MLCGKVSEFNVSFNIGISDRCRFSEAHNISEKSSHRFLIVSSGTRR